MASFISSKKIIDSFKKSKWFKTDLGSVFMPASKDRKFDYTKQSKFMQYYLVTYGSKLYKEGNIGEQISFYTDWKITDSTIVVFYQDEHHFVFQYDMKVIEAKGVDSYLGSLIKVIETEYLPNIVHNKETVTVEDSVEDKYKRAQEKIKQNPGNVSYDDIKDYLKMKKFKR